LPKGAAVTHTVEVNLPFGKPGVAAVAKHRMKVLDSPIFRALAKMAKPGG
jgi:hypothetical protein